MEVFGYTPIRGIYENTEAGISVQEAQENATGLLVVLKLIRCRDVIDINVILEEAMTQKGLDHPCICKVLKAGIFSSGVFIVLEKLEKDLAKELKERGPEHRFYSEWEILEFLKQITGALAYAQEKVSHI
jgi:serine/threonine protein kinase